MYVPEPPAGLPSNTRSTPSHAVAGSGVMLAVGLALTVAVVLALSVHPLASVTVNVYKPAIAVVALGDTVGLCRAELNALGPVHE